MPPRTNDFQELATLIQQAMQPVGAKVTPSAMEPTDFGLREVDVLLESPLGPFTMKVAVEAKDHGRPMDRKEFDSIKGKYTGEGRVAVDRVVIVTRSGFTAAVVKQARALRFELFTLDEARAIQWMLLGPQPWSLQPDPKPQNIHTTPMLPTEVLKNGTVTCVHGHSHGNLKKFVETVLYGQLRKVRRGLLYEITAEALNFGESCRKFSLVPDHSCSMDHEGKSYPVERVHFEIIARYAEATLVFRTITLSQAGHPDRDIVVGDADFGPGMGKQRFILPDGFRSKKVVMEADIPWLSRKPIVFEMDREGPEPVLQADGSLSPPATWKSKPQTVGGDQPAAKPAKQAKAKGRKKSGGKR